jgi:3-deoxy-manno-octulosonate cytidylyltransferase (CMP-KDO synthetase)
MHTVDNVVALIPARLAATRLPDKPLIDICGKPMIQWVWERASMAHGVTRVAICTPDIEIAETASRFGAETVMTSHTHRSGTDRLAEAAITLHLADMDIVVNIQGDEPLLDPSGIEKVAALLQGDASLPMSSLSCPCPPEDFDNPDCVKVVCDRIGNALYFSRSRIPFARKETSNITLQHVGLYAYRASFLKMYTSLAPAPLEQMESLEQLRAIENGYRIRMAFADSAPIGVDTTEDLERVRRILASWPTD